MKSLISLFKKIETTLGSLKFAVIIILIFAVYLAYGTIIESFHGAEYAARAIYKHPFFFLIQLCMFLSILIATLHRMPLQKRLYGFYTLHAGLLILFIGSFISFLAGVDGVLTLYPQTATQQFELQKDQLIIRPDRLNSQKFHQITLPYAFSSKNIDLKIDNIHLLQYYPFAQIETKWQKSSQDYDSAHYLLANEQVQQDFFFSRHPQAMLKDQLQMGPLTINFFPGFLFQCVTQSSDFIIWNEEQKKCLNVQKSKVIDRAVQGEIYQLITAEKTFRFQPDAAPFELDEQKRFQPNSGWRLLNKTQFTQGPNLMLFADQLAFFHQDQWHYHSLTESITLPWMNFQMQLLKLSQDQYPAKIISATKPVLDEGKVVQGNLKAIQIQLDDEIFWVDSQEPLQMRDQNQKIVSFKLSAQSLKLPYEITLNEFRMDTDPGTKNPASYQSFVTVFDGQKTTRHNISMNQPLVHQDFTLYQNSYFKIAPDVYGSTLTVNYDPGRSWKYLGSLLLVLGTLWHFLLRRIQWPLTRR